MNTRKNNNKYIIGVPTRKSKKSISNNESVKISSYNILASGNTNYVWRSHRNIRVMDIIKIQDNDVLIKNGKDLKDISDVSPHENIESKTQTQERYNLISKEIIQSKSDIVCLQECEPNFFNSEMNPQAVFLKQMFDIYLLPIKDPKSLIKGAPCIIKLKQSKKIKKVFKPIFTEFNKYSSSSKGAVILPIESHSNKQTLVVSAHFHLNSEDRIKLVKDIEKIYNNYFKDYNQPKNSNNNSKSRLGQIVVMGDFNLEGPVCEKFNRRHYMAMEFGDIKNTSKYIFPHKSFWYNSNCRLFNNYMTGLDGEMRIPKNIDHIFVYPPNKSIKVECSRYNHLYGPYKENRNFTERIGKNVTNRDIKFDDVYQYFLDNCKPNPNKVVRGSDHKMISINLKY